MGPFTGKQPLGGTQISTDFYKFPVGVTDFGGCLVKSTDKRITFQTSKYICRRLSDLLAVRFINANKELEAKRLSLDKSISKVQLCQMQQPPAQPRDLTVNLCTKLPDLFLLFLCILPVPDSPYPYASEIHDESFARRKQRRNRTTFTLQQVSSIPHSSGKTVHQRLLVATPEHWA